MTPSSPWSEAPARCADCGRAVTPNPAFAVLRCPPCGIQAGQREREAQAAQEPAKEAVADG